MFNTSQSTTFRGLTVPQASHDATFGLGKLCFLATTFRHCPCAALQNGLGRRLHDGGDAGGGGGGGGETDVVVVMAVRG